MENVHRSNKSAENTFVEFFKGLGESYQRYIIAEMEKKPPDIKADTSLQQNYKNDSVFATKADSAGLVGDPESR